MMASDLPEMREIVVDTGSGALVQSVAEIPERLLQIVESFDSCSRAARETFPRYEFSRRQGQVIARLDGLTNHPSGNQRQRGQDEG